MRQANLFLILAALAGCSGSDPVEPPPLPLADLVVEGGAWSSCTSYTYIENNCDFVGEGRNRGTGCADDVRGVTRYYDDSDTQLGPTESWSHIREIRPGEAFTYTVRNVPIGIVDATQSFASEVSCTNVRC